MNKMYAMNSMKDARHMKHVRVIEHDKSNGLLLKVKSVKHIIGSGESSLKALDSEPLERLI